MGESKIVRRVRPLAVAAAALAAASLLSSCSQLGLGATASAPQDSGPVQDPSVVASSETPTPTPVVASPDPVATPTPTATAADGRTAVVPFITAATASGTALQVQAIVPGVVEGSGRCAVTATNGSLTRTADGAAVAASSYTGCEPLTITGLSAGTWQVRVRYASDTAAGASASRTVTAG